MSTHASSNRLEDLLDRALARGKDDLKIVGSSSGLALANLLATTTSKNIKSLPHLIVFSKQSEALQFAQTLEFFDPHFKSTVFEHYDVSPYSSLYSKAEIPAHRVGTLFQAQSAKAGDVFITSVGALLQKTIPFQTLSKSALILEPGAEILDNFNETLQELGYQNSPFAEDVGQVSTRGGIIDIFSPAHPHPIRIELFGDVIESMRFFHKDDQRSFAPVEKIVILPVREVLYDDETLDQTVRRYRESVDPKKINKEEFDDIVRSLALKRYFQGIDFLLPYFYSKPETLLDHFNGALNIWLVDPLEIQRKADELLAEMKSDYEQADHQVIRPRVQDLFVTFEGLEYPPDSRRVEMSRILVGEDQMRQDSEESDSHLPYRSYEIIEITPDQGPSSQHDLWIKSLQNRFLTWTETGYKIFVSARTQSQSERLKLLFERMDCLPVICNQARDWFGWRMDQERNPKVIHIIPQAIFESVRLADDHLIFLREENFFGKKTRSYSSDQEQFQKQAQRLSFGDLKPGDCVVHVKHGVGVYEGLKVMPIQGVDAEFIQLSYKDKDKLYVPVYNVGQLRKYSGHAANIPLDKLGGTQWEKTKVKVKGHLRDLAADLLSLYAQRAHLTRPPFSVPDGDYQSFESSFAYDETDDQLRAIRDVIRDMTEPKPMDRLICGDVGFGKTEVALRAAFKAVQDHKQVAILAPTTVLAFQHLETFKKRMANWPVVVRGLNRFVEPAEVKKTVSDLKEGKVDILIGTHRVLSKDVTFKNLGLLVIDEEQKFGVAHKERIRKVRVNVDTLAMSATPIPRTLNFSLMGIRDLSLINTAPVDRLPIRTFICKFEPETIRKAIRSEINRGGQVFFIHNRVQSIYALAEELKEIVPDVRIQVAHGQMQEHELEQAMVRFFNKEVDVLLCTTIVESGMDIPNANTMFIDNAHQLGLSQLYQLRGRVGRSKQRAYCYLILPRGRTLDKEAQERLKVIQENTALGSGIRVAQYDLELRGAGNILGEEQSGHVDSVGYELYLELLNEAIHEVRGDAPSVASLDPEINLRIPAMIPDQYISDVRIRLSYYRALSQIENDRELENIEQELTDQFGKPPEPVMNLMGLMLIRLMCKQLGIRDLSAGPKNISLIFTPHTPLKTEIIVQLAMKENKKYSVTPDSRLNVRMNTISWTRVYEELELLKGML